MINDIFFNEQKNFDFLANFFKLLTYIRID